MNEPLKVTGRVLPISEATKKRNPAMFEQAIILKDPDGKPTTKVYLPKRIRQDPKPLMNKLETRFFNEVLQPRFTFITAQALRFRLGNGIWFKPDFVVFRTNGTVNCYEVKGPHAFRGGFENLKVAASQYKMIRWALVWIHEGQWKEQEVLP